jgi:uncharacterized protein
MKLELWKKPKKGAIIIEGFAGFGLVGTIASEFLVDHLGAEQIGKLTSDKIPAIIAIHEGEVVEPYAIFYNEKHNLIILRAIGSVSGLEWDIAESTLNLAKEIGAKEIISIEGVGGVKDKIENPKVFYYSNNPQKQKNFEKMGLKQMKEGIIVGVTASLLSKLKEATFLFAESYADFPDSKAGAKIVEVLDKYLGLKVDYKPLVAKANQFEGKIRQLLAKGIETRKEKEIKESENYIG